MIGKRFIQSLLPRPRKHLTKRDWLPLLIFLAGYAVLCASLDLSHRVLFVRPAAFALLVCTPWVWWMHLAGYAGLGKIRGSMAALLRLALVGTFVILLAEPRAVRVRDVVSVIYAVDLSDSIGEGSTDAALKFVVDTVSKKPERDEAGLIVFGRNAAVELPPRQSFPYEAINSQIDRDATNLEQSLSLAAAMLPEENQGRIVLISDGTQTEGSLSRIVDELKSRGVSVDVLPIQYQYDQEVWLERLELPQAVKIGEDYEAAIVLTSLKGGSGKLVLQENGNVIAERDVKFEPGKNRYIIPIRLGTPGYYEYEASIEVSSSQDHLAQNNKVVNAIYVEGEGKVLLVTDPHGNELDWKGLAQVIQEGERAVEVQQAYDFPRDSSSLLPYDCVLFVNVPADAFDAVQLTALQDGIRNLGVGFMMVGGANSFGPGGYHRTVVEEALPVTMDITKKKVLPKGALAIILHTCEFPEGNTWGKRITKQAIKVLGAQDEVGVLAYDYRDGEKWLFELAPASDYDRMVTKINAAEIGDMPSFTSTMRKGLAGLKKSDAATKHMIIISDGDPSPPPPELVQDFIDSKVSVSMVAIFPHGGNDISTMRAIASTTGGRYYFPADPNELPSIFIKESKTLKRTMIQNKPLTPEVGLPSPILKGIEGFPELKGYVLTTAKSRAELVLQSPPDESPEAKGDIDPVLAEWRYGLGRTAAFTSDLSPNWAADWVGWEKYRAFVKQLITDIARVRKEGHLRMWNYTSGNEGVIVVEDFQPEENFLEVQARVSGPRERVETIGLKQVGPRRYQASVPLWGKGKYHVMAVGVAGERTDQAHGGFIVPYSPEYLRFRSNPIALNAIAEKTGGQVLTKDSQAADVYLAGRQPKRSSRAIFDWFLLALACLVPMDVALRRVQLDPYVIKNWLGFGRKAGPSTATMGALLERKQAVGTQIEARRSSGPPLVVRPVGGPSTKPAATAVKRDAPPSKPAAPGKAEDLDNLSTTERLLRMKRKRDTDE